MKYALYGYPTGGKHTAVSPLPPRPYETGTSIGRSNLQTPQVNSENLRPKEGNLEATFEQPVHALD